MTSIDLVSRYYAAFNAKDWTAMAACVAEDINHFVNEGDKRGGRRAFAEFIAHMDDCYDEHLTDIVVMASADGSRAAAEFVVNGVYKKTDAGLPEAHGQTYRLPAGAFFDVAGGAITRVTTYYNLKDWIRQVS
ncbi:MAG: isopropylmalate/homocitrate/citramalate synthase [Hyphomonas sp.]|uniref:ketosteroid isomerase-related protein n=1 Tax=Hyphomonas sp. TaxID=87 RepID=UPI001848253E|nr:ketosteroid isomerase-related protein [Hyphomonas sp.]MBU3920060.1 nuclear transport factor 2 family protein [Alphaproteobacteria bacterium]MBA3070007.1 isopropylmalate/homocitrate/citramalate synthase [Hyphomonas sp.]MBU4060417.1 nuclear transport factor 2 family protein [Alphaproteobacteria bacterium]MBU4163085.1 nuclear transport factor 2 family protein [Alphaproteobacteria bacterium]MBU4569633.1 nuclear transport factor 2 family protein [Alphaproteobacteria bacterium]